MRYDGDDDAKTDGGRLDFAHKSREMGTLVAAAAAVGATMKKHHGSGF